MRGNRTAGSVDGLSGMQEEIDELEEKILEEYEENVEEPETELDY